MSESIKNDEKWLILRRKVQEQELTNFICQLDTVKFEYLLIKGWAASLFYDQPFLRVSSDIDIAVNPEQYEQFIEWDEKQNFNIDLHKGLRHLDTLDWSKLFEASKTEFIDNIPVRVLCAEDHLRVLAVHWLTDGGAYKEKLSDIFFLVKNRPENFDWQRCLGVVSKIRRRWIIITIGLANKYCGLEIDDLEFANEARDIPVWIIKALEKEWKSDLRLQPIHRVLNNPKVFLKQLRKRFPPNPIQAAIECEGDFDKGNIFIFQLKSVFNRLKPSILRIIDKIKGKL